MASETTLQVTNSDVYVFKADKERHFYQPRVQNRPAVSGLYKVEPKFSIRKRVVSSPKKSATEAVPQSDRKLLTPIRRRLPSYRISAKKSVFCGGSHLKTEGTTPETLDSSNTATNSRLKTQEETPAEIVTVPIEKFNRNNTRAMRSTTRHRTENSSKKGSPEPANADRNLPMNSEACLSKFQETLTSI